MGLVDYSESDSGSESEAPIRPAPKPSQTTTKKPFQKVVDRSNPGKIVVNLPQATSSSKPDEPPAKRARTTGGGLFSGLNSFLPPPKNAGKPITKSSGSAPSRPGINLKTSAAPGFSRDADDDMADAESGESSIPSGGMNLPPPKKQEAAPSIPEGQKPADEVKLVGKPLMFRPLSVGFNNKKKKNKPSSTTPSTTSPAPAQTPANGTPPVPAAEPPKKKVSLFSMHTEEEGSDPTPSSSTGTYEPLFESAYQPDINSNTYTDYAQYQTHTTGNSANNPESLDTIASDLNLSAAARRELFGRDGGNFAAKKVVNFNMDKEYQHNESVRAAGDQQVHKAVRSIQGGGKHSLKQLVQNVQNQRDALEDSFATAKSNKRAASSKYGW
ncbi:stress activated map kinase interacting [Pochonia chlamydosporia 170]|uniref:Stress activated map kinase interacting n=1 Tax=Pochonia chlamydosporia 170 TaxID=1380566 RepID=A0A179FS21_METCM|nr:stress activated map kinase interacting [Pochonia chlamydosporia 170]OAQ68157.1 stress activated map kinase interacting [Pochonia chlamydosporia 170]